MNGNFLLFGSPATPSSFMMTQNSQQDLSKYHSLTFQVSMLQELFIIIIIIFLQFGIYGVRVYYRISICIGLELCYEGKRHGGLRLRLTPKEEALLQLLNTRRAVERGRNNT